MGVDEECDRIIGVESDVRFDTGFPHPSTGLPPPSWPTARVCPACCGEVVHFPTRPTTTTKIYFYR